MSGQRGNYSKRSHSQFDYADDVGGKRRNPSEREPYASGPEDTVFRYLCPGRKIGSIIGRGGDIVKQLRSESQSKIKIGETVPGCEDRVIIIFSPSQETNVFEDTGDLICPAQDALFKVHERLVADEEAGEEDPEAGAPQVAIRLLVPSDQIGCIIGKGGQIIQGLRTETGAQIRILKNELLPFAIAGDELLQITGEAPLVKKALIRISYRLHENPSRSQNLLTSTKMYPPVGQFGGPNAGAPVMGSGSLVDPYGGYKYDTGRDWSSNYPAPRDESSAREFSLRLLCPSGNIGGVIGKGGVIIKNIRQESGASVKVDGSADDVDDCIIIISAKEFVNGPISPTIDAAVRLQPRCSDKTDRESGEPSYTTRLLVQTSRIGCLIGKGGSIVTEMRRLTRANIRILSKDNIPKVASEDDEMVQISGELDVARNALVQVTTRLKANFFERDGALSAFPSVVPYIPIPGDSLDGSRYGGGDHQFHGHGYSKYSGGYGASVDLPPLENYAGYSGSQAGGSGCGAYGGYSSGHSGSTGRDL